MSRSQALLSPMDSLFGIYIHIPFCERVCHYCNFPRVVGLRNLHARYFDAVKSELRNVIQLVPKMPVTTLYIGGGTPSCVDHRLLSRFLSHVCSAFSFVENAEVTVECNPYSLTHEWVETLMATGVNRFSLGVQSLNDGELSRLGRLHRAAQAHAAFRLLREVGCRNLSVDLMYGIPGQTASTWQLTLNRIINDWQPEHVSLYPLTIERSTQFYRWKQNNSNNWHWPCPDTIMDWYWTAVRKLEQQGYHRYEISNCAKTGYESRHNQLYWNTASDYLGLGAAAHSFCRLQDRQYKLRFRNTRNVKNYMQRMSAGQRFRFFSPRLSRRQRLGEEIYLGLRLARGVVLDEAKKAEFKDTIAQQRADGLVYFPSPNHMALTKRGVEIANIVMAEYC